MSIRTITLDGIVGPAYTLRSINAECERAMNLTTEFIETQKGKDRYSLNKRAGLLTKVVPEIARVRGMLEVNNQLFAVLGPTPYTLDSAFNPTAYGNVDNDNLPVYWAANRTQAVFTSAGKAYVLQSGEPATPITWIGEQVVSCGFINDYFVFLSINGDGFFYSEPGDATLGTSLNFIPATASANNYVAMIIDHEEIGLFGNRVTQFFAAQDGNAVAAGAAPFVARLSDGTVQRGIAAPAALVSADNSIFWLGGDKEGRGVVWRLNGYTPVRVSNHGVETAVRKMTTVDDCVAWTYQEDGHIFVVFNFIVENQTWVLDVESGHWHQRDWWNQDSASSEAHRGYCATAAFGKIIVGDRTTGSIYVQSLDYQDDDGAIIRCQRRSSDTNNMNKLVTYARMEVQIQGGVGDGSNGDPEQGAVTPEFDPQMLITFSDDNGHTFGDEYSRSMGQQGDYEARVFVEGAGTGRNRVWDLVVTAKVPVHILGATADVIVRAY